MQEAAVSQLPHSVLRAERSAGGAAAAHGDAAYVPVRAPRPQLAPGPCHVLPPAHAPGMRDLADDDYDYYDHVRTCLVT